MKYEIRQLQMEELGILCDVRDVCERNNICYFLGCGTLLGAVRHQGFIPWDDDIDILMPVEDYQRFLEIAQAELAPKYFVQNYLTEQNFYPSYTKIRKNDTAMMCWNDEKYPIHHGIWIDIFPIVNVKGKYDYKLKKKLLKLVNCLQMDAYFYGNHEVFKKDFSKFTIAFLEILYKTPLSFRQSLHKFIWRFFVIQESSKYKTYIWNIVDKLYSAEFFSGKPEKLIFEGEEFSVPPRYHELLKVTYGDYMTLPPVEQRKTHHVEILDYDRSYSAYMNTDLL